MDYPLKRRELHKHLLEFSQSLILNKKLLDSLKRCYPISMESIESASEDMKKTFILLELTINRYSCTQVIKLLRESDEQDNEALADSLEKINTSEGRQTYSNDIEIEVTPTETIDAKVLRTQAYPMTQNPRGKAIIINNVQAHVQRESKRFKNIFEQLLFEVEMLFDLTADEIIDKMRQIKDDINREFDANDEFTPQALIVMIISHGSDEKIYGKKAVNKTEPGDLISTNDIVDTFTAENFEFDDQFVKMFFFICCREIENEVRFLQEEMSALMTKTDNSSDTIVFHSCAEGYQTFYDENRYYTYFGRCLSESIAQYAYKEDLIQIMNRTSSALRDQWGRMGFFAPETRVKGLTNSVYFNPKWFQN